jgi:hypothetical protein
VLLARAHAWSPFRQSLLHPSTQFSHFNLGYPGVVGIFHVPVDAVKSKLVNVLSVFIEAVAAPVAPVAQPLVTLAFVLSKKTFVQAEFADFQSTHPS